MSSIREHLVSGMSYDADDEKKRKGGVGRGYFADCVLVSVPKKNGRGVSYKRIYTGKYYSREISRGKDIRNRLLYCTLYLVSIFFLIDGARRSAVDEAARYFSIPLILAVIAAVWLLVSLVTYLTNPRRLNAFYYRKSSHHLVLTAWLTAAGMGLSAVLCAVHELFVKGNAAGDTASMIEYAAAAAALAAMAVLEKRVPYRELDTPANILDELPEGSRILE